MAKSKDRLMLEKIFKEVSNNGLYDELCSDGKEVLKDLAKHLNKPLSEICGVPVCKSIRIVTEEFEIPDLYDDDTDADMELSVEVVVKRNGKKLDVNVDEVVWW